MTFDDLLELASTAAEREELLEAGQRYCDAVRATSTERQALLEQVLERVEWALRAARHPIPTQHELEAMLMAYFSQCS